MSTAEQNKNDSAEIHNPPGDFDIQASIDRIGRSMGGGFSDAVMFNVESKRLALIAYGDQMATLGRAVAAAATKKDHQAAEAAGVAMNDLAAEVKGTLDRRVGNREQPAVIGGLKAGRLQRWVQHQVETGETVLNEMDLKAACRIFEVNPSTGEAGA